MSNDVSDAGLCAGRIRIGECRYVFANSDELHAFVQFADPCFRDNIERMLAPLIGLTPVYMICDFRKTFGIISSLIRPRDFFDDLVDLLDGKWEIYHGAAYL